jgi:hypothetical protein
MLTGFHQVNVPLPDGANLIHNGDFTMHFDGTAGFYAPQNVPGWSVVQTPTETKVNLIKLLPYNRLGYVLDLDASANTLDQVYQDIATQPGTRYLLSFDFRAHLNMPQAAQELSDVTSEFEVWWNGTLVTAVQPNQSWKTMTIEVFGGNGDFSRLMFSEVAAGRHGGGDGIGALINNVRLVQAMDSPISNGGFEDFGNTRPGPGFRYLADSVPSWNAIGPNRTARILKIEPVRPHPKVGELEYRALNLNGHQGFRDAVFQDLETDPGATYYVRFTVKGNGHDELRVRWDHAWAMTVTPGANWESLGMLVKATDKVTQLMFLEGLKSNSEMWIDNVRIYRVNPGTSESLGIVHPTPDYRFLAGYVDVHANDTKKRDGVR